MVISKFEFEELDLKGAYKIRPFYAKDERGGFIKDYNIDIFRENQGQQYRDRKDCFSQRKRHLHMRLTRLLLPFHPTQIRLIPTADRNHHQNSDECQYRKQSGPNDPPKLPPT